MFLSRLGGPVTGSTEDIILVNTQMPSPTPAMGGLLRTIGNKLRLRLLPSTNKIKNIIPIKGSLVSLMRAIMIMS
jgi:hypothetical protein